MMRLVIVQTRLSEDKIKMLKEKSGKETIKDALSEAVYHYLECPLIDKIHININRSIRGRKPLYLKDYVSDKR